MLRFFSAFTGISSLLEHPYASQLFIHLHKLMYDLLYINLITKTLTVRLRTVKQERNHTICSLKITEINFIAID